MTSRGVNTPIPVNTIVAIGNAIAVVLFFFIVFTFYLFLRLLISMTITGVTKMTPNNTHTK